MSDDKPETRVPDYLNSKNQRPTPRRRQVTLRHFTLRDMWIAVSAFCVLLVLWQMAPRFFRNAGIMIEMAKSDLNELLKPEHDEPQEVKETETRIVSAVTIRSAANGDLILTTESKDDR